MHNDPTAIATLWAWLMNPANADLVNGSFETIGAICAWINVAIYIKHRKVQGVYWPTTMFYSAWGLWNLIYYPALGQWLSFYAGIAITSGSSLWVILVVADKVRRRIGRTPKDSFPPASNLIP